jgi:hypothetical protein
MRVNLNWLELLVVVSCDGPFHGKFQYNLS